MKRLMGVLNDAALRVMVRLSTVDLRRQEGQGMIEYGMIIALVAIIAIAGYKLLGEGLRDFIKNKVLTVFTS